MGGMYYSAMGYMIGYQTTFSAAHFIPDHPKCGKMHGHNYRVEVSLESSQLDKMGFVMDYADLKRYLGNVINPLDHTLLNDSLPSGALPPTAEHISQYITESLIAMIRQPTLMQLSLDWQNAAYTVSAVLVSVKVWETDSSWASYSKPLFTMEGGPVKRNVVG